MRGTTRGGFDHEVGRGGGKTKFARYRETLRTSRPEPGVFFHRWRRVCRRSLSRHSITSDSLNTPDLRLFWFSVNLRGVDVSKRRDTDRPSDGDFQGIGVFRSDEIDFGLRAARCEAPPVRSSSSMSPPGYPSAWLRPRRARFRFT